MPAKTVTLTYIGGLDKVTVFCPTSRATHECAQGESIKVLAATAAGLSPVEWEEKTTNTKDEA